MARNIIFDGWYFDEIMELTVGKEKIDSFKQKSLPLLSTRQETLNNMPIFASCVLLM
jgi:hypothetical protein